MNKSIKNTLVKTLEDNPDLYKIINSTDHIKVLEEISKENQNIEHLQQNIYIKKYIILYNILETLADKKLIKKIKINDKDIYFITESGKKLVEIYNKAKKEFNI